MRLAQKLAIGVSNKLKVLHGKPASETYPFMAWMGTCGASLIDQQWIMTAAHCATKFLENPSPIYFGSLRRENGWKTKHTRVVRHPQFKHNKVKDRVLNDIALIKLEDPVPSDVGKPISLPRNVSLTNYDRFDAIMAGWGYNRMPFLAPSDDLYEAKVVMGGNLPYPFCHIPGKLCSAVGTDYGARMAPGDSGGPLFFKMNGEFVQIGIITVLWLHPRRAFINEFTDVAYYADWIKHVLQKYGTAD